MSACCERCHFADEERLALPHLPPADQQRLLAEHRQLLAMPASPAREAAVLSHACWEEVLFPRSLPLQLVARFHGQHVRLLGRGFTKRC